MRKVTHRKETGLWDDGLSIHASPLVHEKAFAVLAPFLSDHCRIVDLGAGSGAFSKRLADDLENPSGFLRSVRRLLKPGGMLRITTPNVVSLVDRCRFLLRGELAFFGAGLLFSAGHQTILPFWLLEDLFREESYRAIARRFLSYHGLVRRPGRPLWKIVAVPPVDLALWLLGRGIPREAALAAHVCYLVRPERD